MTRNRTRERGMTLIELIIAMVVLAIGLGALAILFGNALFFTGRNNRDTSGTFLAKMVLEAISAQHSYADAPVTITDCQGNSWTIDPNDAALPGAGAALVTDSGDSHYGSIDQTQDPGSIPSGYYMKYADCGTGGSGTPIYYDVRWNVTTITINPSINGIPNATQTRLITVSARPASASANQLGGRMFAIPVSLRGIAGP